MSDQTTAEAQVIKVGVFTAIVCVPKGLTRDEVGALGREALPTCGTANGWMLRDDEADSGNGLPNPCHCEDDPNRQHYMFDA